MRKTALAKTTAAPPLNEAPTFGQLFRYYMEHHGKNCRSARSMRGNFRRYLGGIAARRSDLIQVTDILQLHTHLGKHVGQAAANRALEIIKAVYNKAIRWRLIDFPNPALPVPLYSLEARDRFLSSAEFRRLMDAVEETGSGTFKAFVKVCLFTGARQGNVRSMRWQDLDWDSKTWRIPMTKSGKPQVVALIPEAIEAIESQRGKHPNWVFPGQGKDGHYTRPSRSWNDALKAAGLKNVRIHDLRRTMGSWQAKTGASLPIISKTLGHSNPRATAIYARLDIEPIRQSMELAARAMQGQAQPAAALPLDEGQLQSLADRIAALLGAKQDKSENRAHE